jgi:hypothetical protein
MQRVPDAVRSFGLEMNQPDAGIVYDGLKGHDCQMPNSKNQPPRSSTPTAALQAALSGVASEAVRRSLWLDALEQQLRPCLPPPLASHCRLANVSGSRLVFLVDSPVWRAKLRLAAPEIINLARSIGLAATEVTAKVNTVPPVQRPAPVRNTLPLSAASRDALQAALASLESPDSTGLATSPARRLVKHSVRTG